MHTFRCFLPDLGAFSARAPRWPPPGPGLAFVRPSIPATFTCSQADKVLELERVGQATTAGAALLLQAWTPSHFSRGQAECITQMLRLDPKALYATLADALEPGSMRDLLRAGAASAAVADLDFPTCTTA